MKKIVWTLESAKRLREIEDYIAGDNPHRDAKFIDRLIEKTEAIVQFPYKGRIVPEFSLREIREIIVKKYRIVYRIKHDCIEILTVFESHHLLRISEIFSED